MYTPHPTDPWSDYAVCKHPRASQRGLVLPGRECRLFSPRSPGNTGRLPAETSIDQPDQP